MNAQQERLARTMGAFRRTMKDASNRFAKGSLAGVPMQAELQIGAMLAAAYDIAKESDRVDYYVRFFAQLTGAELAVDGETMIPAGGKPETIQ